MSAHLFIMEDSWFESTPVDALREYLSFWEETMRKFESDSSLQHNRFHLDRYRGFTENRRNAQMFLKGYARGKNESLD